MKMKMKTSGGFTLIELMVTFAILAILAGIASPSYSAFLRRSEAIDAARGFESALKIAQHKARTSGRSISICPSENINVTTPTCSGNWSAFNTDDKNQTLGWVVFQDFDNDNTIDAKDDANDIPQELIQKIPFLKSQAKVLWNGGNQILINTRGRTGNGGTLCAFVPNNGETVGKCDSSGALKSEANEVRVILSPLGNVRIEK